MHYRKSPFLTISKLFLLIFLISCSSTPTENNTSSIGAEPSEPDTSSSSNDSQPTESSKSCGLHLAMGNPGQYDQLLCRDGFAIGYNYQTRLADWAAYHITQDSVSISLDRKDNFREDKEIPESLRAKLDDYAGSGYDRGHLAPRATVDFTEKAMDESFLLSNIAPQLPSLNRAGWADLEEYVRACTVEKREMYVFTGPIFNTNPPENWLNDHVAIPDSYYKVLMTPSTPPSGFAFLIPHQAVSATELADFITSIDVVETATGLDFFSAINDAKEETMESNTIPFCSLPWSTSNTGATGNGGADNHYTCGTKKTCSQMVSCDEARYYLNSCGVSSLDRDKDGIPCESICGN